MKSAPTLEQQKRWVKQWERAGKALLKIKIEDLRNLTSVQAAAIANMLLQCPHLCWQNPERNAYSGLVEQQRLFIQWLKRK